MGKTQRTSYRQGWKLYPFEFLGHHIQGAICGFLILTGAAALMLAAAVWALLYVAYQGLSVIRKGDSAGLDVADFLVGLWLGIILGLVAGVLT
ncbi:MAG: hypothetical protein OXC91_00875 [Rhodobacteraceae bacterium]|nr:hypothetical protein [Paracoccaceae bacterium]